MTLTLMAVAEMIATDGYSTEAVECVTRAHRDLTEVHAAHTALAYHLLSLDGLPAREPDESMGAYVVRLISAAREDSARLDWLESINPIGCWDGWIEQGESSHAVTVWLGGDDGKTPREAIDAARADEGEGR